MLQIILAQNRQRAIDGLAQLSNNITILENSNVPSNKNDIINYKNEIKQYNELLQNEDIIMDDIDNILTFISITDKIIINKFT